MKKEIYQKIENYMLSCMEDSAHDKAHVYRVLYLAMEIAEKETPVDYDILISACLLHDIGRKEQFADPRLCHAQVGSEKAYRFLREMGFSEDFAGHVRDCILTHRFRKGNPPQSIEARILFDADKLDVTGTIGIARTLLYAGEISAPLYTLREDGTVSDGIGEDSPSFFREYKFKLEKLYGRFYTDAGTALAASRQQAAADFYNALYGEVSTPYLSGPEKLAAHIR